MRVVLVGPPGAGKGTQAEHIATKFDIPAISTGEIFRANVTRSSKLGLEAKRYMDAGDLVPDAVTIAMVRDRLSQDDAADGFLLDGFPRTVPQAEALREILAEMGHPLSAVLELRIGDEEVIRRLSGRRTCRSCSTVWHVEFKPSSREGMCDQCGGQLFQRDDDLPRTIRRRLEVYAEQTAPLVEHYRSAGLLLSIEAVGSVDEVSERATSALLAAAA